MFIDDQGLTTYLNVKFTILPAKEPLSYLPLTLLVISCFLGTSYMLFYAQTVNMDLQVIGFEDAKE